MARLWHGNGARGIAGAAAGRVVPPNVLIERRLARRSLHPDFTPGPRRRFDKLRIALLAPLSGPAGLWGPSCQTSALLASQEINARGGIEGREVELLFTDAGCSPEIVTEETMKLVTESGAEAVIGMHISAVRLALVRALRGRVPYVYTPVYEGGEQTPGVFMIGETPALQLRPSIAWMAEHRHVRRWYLAGNDYIWPRVSHEAARRYVAKNGGEIVGETFVPFGTEDYDATLDAIRKSRADAVLVSMVGNDCVAFNRAFAESGLARHMLRLSAASEENTLLGIGADNAENLYFAAGYLSNMRTAENEAFLDRYYAAFGADAPMPNTIGQSCYEGVRLYGELVRRAGAFDVAALGKASEGLTGFGARGNASMRARHLRSDIYLAEADGLDFRILQRFPAH